MKILFAAPVIFDRRTLFISQYTTGLAKAAKYYGHEVRLVQTTENNYNPILWKIIEKEFDILRIYFKNIIDIPHDFLLINQLKRVYDNFKPDIFFILVQQTSYLHRLIKYIRTRGTICLTWVGIHPLLIAKGRHKLSRECNYLMLYDDSYIDYYENVLNLNNIIISNLGCDLNYYDKFEPGISFVNENAVDVCFIGQIDPYRENILKQLTEFDLGIWSWNIQDYDTVLKKFHKGNADGEQAVKIMKSCKIIVNIHRSYEEKGGNYRLFEIPASRSFQISDHKEGINNLFELDKEIVTFKNTEELKTKIKYYLQHDDERIRIANAGYLRMKKDHTLINRMDNILNTINSRIEVT